MWAGKAFVRQIAVLLVFLCGAGCAYSQLHSVPKLENRTLRISTKVPGFEYQWMECTKKFLGVCRNWEARVEYYDLTNPETRDRLIAMGFVGRVRERVTP